MKRGFILIFVVLFLHQSKVFAKDSTTIFGNIVGLEDSIVRLSFPLIDSIYEFYDLEVTHGKFQWKGVVAQPERVYLMMKSQFFEFFIDTGNTLININGKASSIGDLKVTGSKPQDEYEFYKKSIKEESKRYYALHEDKIYKARLADEESEALWNNKKNEILIEIRRKRKAFISEHPSSIVSMSLIERVAPTAVFSSVDSLYKLLSSYAKNTNAGKRIAESLSVLKRVTIGEPFIDFVQGDTSGLPVKLSDYKGKYVLLDFWASWCAPCRAENPNILSAYNMYKDKNFTVLAVSLDEDLIKWKNAIVVDKMPWQQVSDLKGFENSIAKTYGISSIPYNFLIDPDGIIIAKDLRDVALKNKLVEIFDK